MCFSIIQINAKYRGMLVKKKNRIVLFTMIMLLLIGILPEMSLTKEVGEAFDNQGSYLYMLKQANIFSHILLAVISA